jgi:hypothetical protein
MSSKVRHRAPAGIRVGVGLLFWGLAIVAACGFERVGLKIGWALLLGFLTPLLLASGFRRWRARQRAQMGDGPSA